MSHKHERQRRRAAQSVAVGAERRTPPAPDGPGAAPPDPLDTITPVVVDPDAWTPPDHPED